MNKVYFTSESVTEGHPDKICDQISDMILDEAIPQNPKIQLNCETFLADQMIILSGKIKPYVQLDTLSLVREKLKDIGFDHPDSGLDISHLYLIDYLKRFLPSSIDRIDQQTESKQNTITEGAEDQGIYFGYACRESESLMPLPIMLAHQLARQIDLVRKQGRCALLPYGKTQVTVEYRNRKPIRIDTIVISVQTSLKKIKKNWKKNIIEQVIQPIIPKHLLDTKTRYIIQISERKLLSGLTGRKLTVDTYGGYARHGGGAFSGKDLSKLDRSATYMARYIAKNIVAAELADYCEVQLAYAIGYSQPISLNVQTFQTAKITEDKIVQLIQQNFQLETTKLISQMQFDSSQFQKLAVYGHFGRTDLDVPWERTDKAIFLRNTLRSAKK